MKSPSASGENRERNVSFRANAAPGAAVEHRIFQVNPYLILLIEHWSILPPAVQSRHLVEKCESLSKMKVNMTVTSWRSFNLAFRMIAIETVKQTAEDDIGFF